MSDQLKTSKASDLDAEQGIGGSDTSSAHVAKKAIKREPSMLLQMLDAILILKNRYNVEDEDEEDKVAVDRILNRIVHGDIQEVDEAINYDITAVDNFWNSIGYSLLDKAADTGLTNLVRVLLKYSDKSMMNSSRDRNPLFLACCRGRVESVKLLLGHGFDPNLMCDDQYHTCLTAVCSSGYLAMVRLLLEHGAKVDLANHGHETPLGYACRNGYIEVARLLLDHGADVNAINKDGKTALIVAVRDRRSHRKEMIQLLLERGADPALPDRDGRVALDYVADGSEIAQMIINSQLEHILK